MCLGKTITNKPTFGDRLVGWLVDEEGKDSQCHNLESHPRRTGFEPALNILDRMHDTAVLQICLTCAGNCKACKGERHDYRTSLFPMVGHWLYLSPLLRSTTLSGKVLRAIAPIIMLASPCILLQFLLTASLFFPCAFPFCVCLVLLFVGGCLVLDVIVGPGVAGEKR